MAEAITLKKEDISKPVEGMTKAVINSNNNISKLVTTSIGSIKTTLIPAMSDLFKSENRKKADSIAKNFADEKKNIEQKYRDEQKKLKEKQLMEIRFLQVQVGSEKEIALKEKEHLKENALKEKEQLNSLINLETGQGCYLTAQI